MVYTAIMCSSCLFKHHPLAIALFAFTLLLGCAALPLPGEWNPDLSVVLRSLLSASVMVLCFGVFIGPATVREALPRRGDRAAALRLAVLIMVAAIGSAIAFWLIGNRGGMAWLSETSVPDIAGSLEGMLALPVFCLTTGVGEEVFLCGILFVGLRCLREDVSDSKGNGMKGVIADGCASALLFGIAHLDTSLGFGPGVLRVLQATLFGFCMVMLSCWTKGIIASIGVHAVFDAVYFVLPFLYTGSLPPYPWEGAGLLILEGTTVLLLGVACSFIGYSIHRRALREPSTSS